MIFLGMIFVVAGFGKLVSGVAAFDTNAFPSFLPVYITESIYVMLPYIEIGVGSLLIAGVLVKFAIILSSGLIIGFAITNILLIISGAEECASCFGLEGSFTPTATLVIDGIMALLVLAVLLCYRGSFFSIKPWFINKGYGYV